MWYKYICENVARRHGKTVTFMPKLIFEDNGSGMHTHTSLWKDGSPLFAGDGYAGLGGLGQLGLWAGWRPAEARAHDRGLRSTHDQLIPLPGAPVRCAG